MYVIDRALRHAHPERPSPTLAPLRRGRPSVRRSQSPGVRLAQASRHPRYLTASANLKQLDPIAVRVLDHRDADPLADISRGDSNRVSGSFRRGRCLVEVGY